MMRMPMRSTILEFRNAVTAHRRCTQREDARHQARAVKYVLEDLLHHADVRQDWSRT